MQSILVLGYKKRNDHKILHPSAKLIASDSHIDETFKSILLTIMTKIKSSASEDWIVETIAKHTFKTFEC